MNAEPHLPDRPTPHAASPARSPAPSRRRFLAGALAAPSAGGLLTSTLLAQETEPDLPPPPRQVPDDQKVGFCVVGLGNFAMNQMLPSFAATVRCKPTALMSGDRDKAERLANQYGIDSRHLYGYDDWARLADDDTVDVVYVVTPTGLHAEQTVAAFEAGKHVLCEKPMASSVEECQRMIDAARAADRTLMIAYRVRYEPFNNRLIEITEDRELGDPRLIVADVNMTLRRPGTWRSDPSLNGGGGPLMDLGVYAVQAQRYAAGREPTHVTAQSVRLPDDERFPEGVETTIVWTLRFGDSGEAGSPLLATGTTGWDSTQVNRVRAVYTDGFAELEPATAYGGLQMRIGRQGKVERVTDLQNVNQFAAELDHMAECVQENRTPHTPGEEGLQDVRVMKAIYRAAAEGREVEI